MQSFDFELGVADLVATIGYVRGLDGCSGTVGMVGYCLGRSLAYMKACFTDTDAAGAGRQPPGDDSGRNRFAGKRSAPVDLPEARVQTVRDTREVERPAVGKV